MVFLAMLVAVLLYLDRICLSTASGAVQKDLGLTSLQLDRALSAFFWTYAFFQLPAGWLGDRFGARYVLAAYLALWSISTGLLGAVSSFGGLIVLRLACGLFEAGAYPVAAGIVGRWMPVHQRGVANGLVAVGGRLGGALAPIITVQLMLWWSHGDLGWSLGPAVEPDATSWRPVMVIYGVLGVLVAIIFAWRFRDYPSQHPLVNASESDLISAGGSRMTVRAARDATPSGVLKSGVRQSTVLQDGRGLCAPPIGSMCRDVSLWLNSFVQFASNFGWAFLVTSMPKYLREVHQSTAGAQGWLQSLPLACGILGMLLGGVLLDAVTRRFGLRRGRVIMLCLPRILVGLAFFGCSTVTSPLQATIFLAVVGLATDLSVSAMWAYGQDVGGAHVGSVVGWANMWGNLGAALSPIVFGGLARIYLDDVEAGWNVAFVACGLIQLLAAVAALGINAERPLQVEVAKL
jgi:MFS family permease